jgi:chorismate-pyruvate lyase
MLAPNIPTELSPIIATSLLGAVPLIWLPASAIPAPYNQLLVHHHDMTSELAAFHGDSITLTVLHAQQSDIQYLREVTLHTATTGLPVEYGLIEILLDSFPADLRPSILAGKTPLGAILTSSGLPFRSETQGYFTVPAPTLKSIFPESPAGAILYGRYNHLVYGENTILARILEILPTSPSQAPPLITDH